jgi:hypothetical protein
MPKMRFNHMELTLPKGTFTDEWRADIDGFYGSVLGWEIMSHQLGKLDTILLRPDDGQFILLAQADAHLASPGMDHLGLLVDTREEVDALLDMCRRYAEKDDRVHIVDYTEKDLVTGNVTVHAFYVRYLLPLYFDIQVIEHAPGAEPAKRWDYV